MAQSGLVEEPVTSDVLRRGISGRALDQLRRIRRGDPFFSRARPRLCAHSTTIQTLIVAVLALAYTGLIVHYSMAHGRLILFPTYDDISYIDDGLSRLQTLYDAGPATFLKMYAILPPHAPWSTLVASAAFAILGVHDWAPYAANVLLILGYFGFAEFLLRGLPRWQKLLCVALLASIPLVSWAVEEFRPDHASALFLAIGLVLILNEPFVTSSRRYLAMAGAFCGLAVLAKPTTFIGAGALIGAALVLAALCDRWGERLRASPRQIASAWAACLIPFILVPLPHFLVGWREVVGYIYDNVFGRYRDIWQTKGSASFHILYYLNGEGAHVMFGGSINPPPPVPPHGIPGHLLLISVILAAAIVRLLWRARRRELVRAGAIFVLLFGSYLIPTLLRNKTTFFGLGFQTLLLFVAVLAFRDLLLGERLSVGRSSIARFRLASAALVFITALSLAEWRWPARVGDWGADWIRNRREIVDGIYRDIRDNTDYQHPIVFVTAPGELDSQLIDYLALKDGRVMHSYGLELQTDDPAVAIAEFGKAHFVVASDQGSELIADFLPAYKIQDQLVRILKSRPDYAQVGRYIYHRSGKGYYLFEHIGSFFGWRPMDGFGEMEGPYPQVPLPEVRWGYGPTSQMKLTSDRPGKYILDWRARNWFRGQIVTVAADGRTIAEIPLTASNEFAQTTIPFELSSGEHVLELHYAQWDKNQARPLAVLFSQVRIRPVD